MPRRISDLSTRRSSRWATASGARPGRADVPVSTSIARRYADAYFTLARDAGEIDAWGRDLSHVAEALTNAEVASALANPRLSIAERSRLAMDLLKGVPDHARNLARLLV